MTAYPPSSPPETPVPAATPAPYAQGPPWNPWSYLWIGMLCGTLGAAIMARINWERLGQPERRSSTRWALVVGVVMFGALVAAVYPEISLTWIGLWALANGLLSFGLVRQQVDAYREWQHADLPPPIDINQTRPSQPVTIANLVALLLIGQVIGLYGLSRVLTTSGIGQPPKVFQSEDLTFTYSHAWEMIDPDSASCGTPIMECLVSLTHPSGRGLIEIASMPMWGTPDMVDLVAGVIVEGLALDAEITAENPYTVNDQPAYEILIRNVAGTDGSQLEIRMVMFIAAGKLHFFALTATDATSLSLFQAEQDAILDSLTFAGEISPEE